MAKSKEEIEKEIEKCEKFMNALIDEREIEYAGNMQTRIRTLQWVLYGKE